MGTTASYEGSYYTEPHKELHDRKAVGLDE